MHRPITALTIAALLMTCVPVDAQMQPIPGAPAALPVAATAAPSAGELISSLDNAKTVIPKLRAMNGISTANIHPVNVAQIATGSDAAAVNSAIARNQTQLRALRNTIGRLNVVSNTNQTITVSQFLADNKMTVANIVGADVNNGSIVLFIQRP